MSFFAKLQKETVAEREALYGVQLIADSLRGDITRETYIEYLTQAYHHVRHTLPLLMAAGSRVPQEKEWLRRSFAEYIAEEIGHEEWILNDIKNSGGDAEKAKTSEPLLPVDIMISCAYDCVMRRNPVGFLGMVFVLEGTSTALALKAADKLQEALGLPKKCFSYLLSHGALDVEHMQFFEKTVNQIVDEKDQQDIIRVARVMYQLFADMFRAIAHKNAGAGKILIQ